MDENTTYYLALSLLKYSFYRRFSPLLKNFTSKEIFYLLNPDFKNDINELITSVYGNDLFEIIDKISHVCEKNDTKIIPFDHQKYPEMLKNIYDPPPVIFINGNFVEQKSVSIVGTRKSDQKSVEIGQKLSAALAEDGYSIISGMAVGIDRAAHVGALNAAGSTIGIIAGGIADSFPRANMDVYKKMMKTDNCCIISEYPPGTRCQKWSFVKRNRIISAMSQGTVIVKASEKSGAMITANYAIEQNREVFVCPGNSYDREYAGCFKLLKDGANIVYDSDSIKEILDTQHLPKKRKVKLKSKSRPSKKENKLNQLYESYKSDDVKYSIIKKISCEKISVDEISRNMDVNISILKSKLIELELDGIIKVSGQNVELNG